MSVTDISHQASASKDQIGPFCANGIIGGSLEPRRCFWEYNSVSTASLSFISVMMNRELA